MNRLDRWNVELVAPNGNTLYLALNHSGTDMVWSRNAEDAFEYDDESEAHDDATRYGGEVFHYTRTER